MRRAVQQRFACGCVSGRRKHARQRVGDQASAVERERVALGGASLHVQRLRAVRERVQRRPRGDVERQVERQADVVDDPDRVRTGAAALHDPVRRADAVERRPLRARIGRRNVDDRLVRLGGGELAGVDRRAAADREEPVCGDRNLHAMRRHLGPPLDVRQIEDLPACARDHERPLDPRLRQHRRQVVEAPADDHERRSRANAVNARAARVSARPDARTRRISRSSSSCSTRASTSVPAARSFSIDEREMNVTP